MKADKRISEPDHALGAYQTARTFVIAIGVVFGSQILRVLFPLTGWYLRDTRMLDTFATLAPYLLGPFVLGLAASWLAKRLPARRSLVASAGGLLLARLALQASSMPAVELVASIVGVTCFIWFLSFSTGLWRDSVVIGLLAGLGLDTWLKGLAGTLDLSWMPGFAPLVITLALAVVCAFLLRFTWRQGSLDSGLNHSQRRAAFGLGPWLFLNGLILQNQGWVATVTGWSSQTALLFLMLGNAAALWLASGIRHRPPSPVWMPAFLLATAASTQASGLLFVLASLLALAGGGYYLRVVLAENASPEVPGDVWSRLSLAVGMLVLGVLVLFYYASLGIRLPFGQQAFPLLAVLLMMAALAARKASLSSRAYLPGSGRLIPHSLAIWLAVPWLIGPAILLLVDALEHPPPANGSGNSFRLMTYNIHSAYNTAGGQDPAAIAALVEEAGADVVAFQEISRGWLLNGSTDLVAWLGRRLEMPYVLFASSLEDPLWGNAIMSRFPIVASAAGSLPRHETLIGRGYTRATIELGSGQELLVINTHLSDTAEDLTALHLEQLSAILESWAGREPAVLLGDMNAQPGSAEMAYLLDQGFRDAWEAGRGPGFTAPAIAPTWRLDWIFHTPDLVASEAAVLANQASDHFPVVVSLQACEPLSCSP